MYSEVEATQGVLQKAEELVASAGQGAAAAELQEQLQAALAQVRALQQQATDLQQELEVLQVTYNLPLQVLVGACLFLFNAIESSVIAVPRAAT